MGTLLVFDEYDLSVGSPTNRMLTEESEQDTCGNGRANHAGNVRTHGMHEQEVVGIGLQAFLVGNAGCHRNGTDTGITDERVDFVTLRQEEVHDVYEADTAGSCNDESKCTECKNLDGIQGEELTGLRGATHGEAEEHHDNIVQGRTCSLGQTGGLGTLFQQVAEEQHTEQWQAGGNDEGRDEQADDGE